MSDRLSGQVTVSGAGTAVQFPDVSGQRFVMRAHPGNTGTVAIGNDGAGSVSTSTGFLMEAGDAVEFTGTLAEVFANSGAANDRVTWLRVG